MAIGILRSMDGVLGIFHGTVRSRSGVKESEKSASRRMCRILPYNGTRKGGEWQWRMRLRDVNKGGALRRVGMRHEEERQ